MRLAALLLSVIPLVASAPSSSPVEQLAEVALAFAQSEASKLGGEHHFKIAQPPRVPHTQPGTLEFEASHLSKREPMGHFFVVVNMKVDGEKVGMVRVDIDGTWAGTLLRAKGNLTRSMVLTAEQVEPSPFEGVPPEGALTEIPESMRLMRAVTSGKILTRGDLEAIPIIQSGDKVRLTATHASLTVSIDTTARSRGALGDRVQLEAPGARRPVTAIITGPGEARMMQN
jgi:flagella basal body P-ring formation protein FlgA